MNTLSATILPFTILDPLGHVPNFIAWVRVVPEERRVRVIAREPPPLNLKFQLRRENAR